MASSNENIRFVTFYIKGFLFGLDIFSVREIHKQLEYTEVPLAPEEVLGLVNLRGQILTMIDTSLLLKLGNSEVNKNSRYIILKTKMKILDDEIDTDGEIYGLLVDKIGDVIETEPNKIEAVPSNLNAITSGLNVEYVKKILKLDNNIMMVLNLEQLFKGYIE
jgi:purine-binding chemotaxis protein CheW